MKGKFNAILSEAQTVLKIFPTRKECAEYFLTQKYPHVMFRLLDHKDPVEVIWKMVKPAYSKPFKIET